MSLCWELMQPCGGFKSGSWQTVMLTRRKTRSRSYFNFKSELPIQSRERFNIYSFLFFYSFLCPVPGWNLHQGNCCRLRCGNLTGWSLGHLIFVLSFILFKLHRDYPDTKHQQKYKITHCSLGIFPIAEVVPICEVATAWHTLWRQGSEYARLTDQQRWWSSISLCCLTSADTQNGQLTRLGPGWWERSSQQRRRVWILYKQTNILVCEEGNKASDCLNAT